MDKLELFAWSAHICTKTRPCSCFRLHKSLFKPWQRHTRADVSRDLLRKFGRRYVFLLFWSLSPPSHCGDVPCRAVPSHRVSAWVTLRELWVLTSTLKLLPLPRVAGPWLCVCVCVCISSVKHSRQTGEAHRPLLLCEGGRQIRCTFALNGGATRSAGWA